jgi:hypothetical protein
MSRVSGTVDRTRQRRTQIAARLAQPGNERAALLGG